MSASWNKEWLELQKQYLDTLASLGHANLPREAAADEPLDWQRALAQSWGKSLQDWQQLPGPVFSTPDRGDSSWQDINKQFTELIADVTRAGDKELDWQKVLKQHIQGLKEQVGAANGLAGIHPLSMGPGAVPDSWPHLFKVLMQSAGGQYAVKTPASAMASLFSQPASSIDPDLMKTMQQGLQCWQSYQDNYRQYREYLEQMSLDALDRLQDQLCQAGEQGKAMGSLREFYDLWVECHEQVYAQYVNREDYSRLYGQLVNSLLQCMAHMQALGTLHASNPVSRDESDDNALAMELRSLKRQQEEDKQRIRQLEEELERKQGGSQDKPRS